MSGGPLRSRTATILGGGLVAIALLGYATVADDLRHTGELFAVTGLLVAGLALLTASRFPRLGVYLDLAWVPVGVGVGMLGGAALDREVVGVCLGVLLGLLLARLRRRREPPSGRPA